MKDASNGHNAPCEQAKLHRCRCATCGGSLHGFSKWLEFVDPPADGSGRREAERRAVDDQLKKAWRTERSRRGRPSRRACVDFFRFSLVDWLARDGRAAAARPRSTSADSASKELLAVPRSPVAVPGGGVAAPNLDDGAGGPSDGDGPIASTYHPASPADEKIWSLARAVAIPSWKAAEDELDQYDRRKVAETHLWCGLFLALAEAVQSISDATDAASAALKERVKRSLLQPGRSEIGSWMTDKLVDKVVDTAVSAFVGWLGGVHVLFDPEVREEVVRLLRVLAVLCCPAPSDHEALQKHAMAPLAHDAAGVVSDAAKEHMSKVFEEWMKTGEVAAPRREEPQAIVERAR